MDNKVKTEKRLNAEEFQLAILKTGDFHRSSRTIAEPPHGSHAARGAGKQAMTPTPILPKRQTMTLRK
jgi:hypothetical protein